MTIDHPIRRVLSRICSAETMASIVDPILADITWERGRPAWRGYADLIAALLIHGVTSVPEVMSSIWSGDRHALPKAALLCGVVALPSTVLLTLAPLSGYDDADWTSLLLLMPQALVLSLPSALLAAIPIALRGVVVQARVVRRMLTLALSLVAVTLVLMWTVPKTNQAFREHIAGQPVAPGSNERGFTELRAEIRLARQIGGNDATVRRLEHRYQTLVALICAPLPLTLLALGLAASRAGRRWPIATGLSGTALYYAVVPSSSMAAWWLLRESVIPPTAIAWIPNVLMLTLAAVLFQKRACFPQNKSNAIPPSP
jgi:hypothetical protein